MIFFSKPMVLSFKRYIYMICVAFGYAPESFINAVNIKLCT